MMRLVHTEKLKSIYVKQDAVEKLFSFPKYIKHIDAFIIFKTANSTDCVQTHLLHQLRYTSRAVKILRRSIKQLLMNDLIITTNIEA